MSLNNKQYKEILDDHVHGSRYITTEVLKFLANGQLSNNEISTFLDDVSTKFRDMQLLQFECKILENSNNPITKAKERLLLLAESTGVLISKSSKYIMPASTVLTFSHSSMVSEVLTSINPKKIYCLLSSPEDEGKTMADEVEGALLSEDKLETVISQIDILCLGCDQYNESHLSTSEVQGN